jgi:hypothetical protein
LSSAITLYLITKRLVLRFSTISFGLSAFTIDSVPLVYFRLAWA